MGVMVRFGNRKAFLRRGAWLSADAGLESRLNRATDDWIQQTGGPPINDRDHERTVAEEIATRFGGRVAKHVPPPASQSAQIYISRRQMRLDFS